MIESFIKIIKNNIENKSILIVSHGGTIITLLNHLTNHGVPKKIYNAKVFPTLNTFIYELNVDLELNLINIITQGCDLHLK